MSGVEKKKRSLQHNTVNGIKRHEWGGGAGGEEDWPGEMGKPEGQVCSCGPDKGPWQSKQKQELIQTHSTNSKFMAAVLGGQRAVWGECFGEFLGIGLASGKALPGHVTVD